MENIDFVFMTLIGRGGWTVSLGVVPTWGKAKKAKIDGDQMNMLKGRTKYYNDEQLFCSDFLV